MKISNEIVIFMKGANESPEVFVGGKVVEGIISLEYRFITSDNTCEGVHNYKVEYIDSGSRSIRVLENHRITLGTFG